MSGQRFKDKVTIITGGSKGIGEGCVRVFVKNGAKVVFCARGDKEGKSLEEEMNKLGPGEAHFVKADVSKEEDLKNVVDVTISKFGTIDCLINNAGWHPPHKPIDEFSANDLRDLFNLNVVNYFIMCKLTLPYLRQTKGSIINCGSVVNHLGQVGAVTYVTTKGAIAAMTRALAVDEAKYGVRVNTISPSNVMTPLWEAGAKSMGDAAAAIRAGANAQLLGRFGTLEEMGEAFLYFAAEGTFCTGIDLLFSGGAELNYGNKSRIRENTGIYE